MLLMLAGLLLCVPAALAAPAEARPAPHPAARLTTVDWESYHEREHEGPGSYAFGYDVQDPASGNVQFREESRSSDGAVRGSYGLVEPDGNVRIVHYIADHRGFRVQIENSQRPGARHPGGPSLLQADSRTTEVAQPLQTVQQHSEPPLLLLNSQQPLYITLHYPHHDGQQSD